MKLDVEVIRKAALKPGEERLTDRKLAERLRVDLVVIAQAKRRRHNEDLIDYLCVKGLKRTPGDVYGFRTYFLPVLPEALKAERRMSKEELDREFECVLRSHHAHSGNTPRG